MLTIKKNPILIEIYFNSSYDMQQNLCKQLELSYYPLFKSVFATFYLPEKKWRQWEKQQEILVLFTQSNRT